MKPYMCVCVSFPRQRHCEKPKKEKKIKQSVPRRMQVPNKSLSSFTLSIHFTFPSAFDPFNEPWQAFSFFIWSWTCFVNYQASLNRVAPFLILASMDLKESNSLWIALQNLLSIKEDKTAVRKGRCHRIAFKETYSTLHVSHGFTFV